MLSLRLSVQEEAVELCHKMGVALLSAADETLYSDVTPEGIFKRQIMGAVDEYSHNKICSVLRDGRERKRAGSTTKTWANTNKVEGRRSFLELHPKFVQTVSTILKRPFGKMVGHNKKKWKARDIATQLFELGIKTQVREKRSAARKEKTKPSAVNSGSLVRWLKHCDERKQ
jgi:hypothetical protein